MHTRFLTYDLNDADIDDYQELYELIEKYGGKQITESTYEINSEDNWITFKQNFFDVTHYGDNIKAIVYTGTNIEVRTIR